MIRCLTLPIAFFCFCLCTNAQQLVINEIDYDPVGTDGPDSEFVELFDGGSGNTSLDGFVLVFYNGKNRPDPEYRIIDLSGQQTDASGFFVVTTPGNGIQNGGNDGMALYRGAAADDFDGTTPLTPPAGAVLVDALVYEIGDNSLAAGLNYNGPNLNDSGSPEGISRVPDGTGEFQLAALTRGLSNSQVVNPELQLSVIPGIINEDAGSGTVELSITRDGDISSPLTVNLSSSDTTEATVAANASFAANEDEISIDIDILDDTAQDGTQTVTFTASAPGYTDGTTTLRVTDNDDVAAATVYINEVDYDPVSTDGPDSEFVELFDGGSGNTSLDGFVLVFYNGRSRPDPEYRIIDLSGQQTDASGFFVVTTPGNGIQNGGNDGMALYRGAAADDFDGTTPLTPPAGAVLVDALVYEIGDNSLAAGLNYNGPNLNDSGSPEGISRVPDGTGEFQLAPLTRGISNNRVEEISASLNAQTLSENGGSVILTVSLDSAAEGDTPLDVALSNKAASVDTSELAVPAVVVPDGQLSVDVTLSGIDDAWRDFDQVITMDISHPLNRFFPASIEVTVTDDETGSPVGTGLRINEVYAAVGQNTDANGDGDTGTADGSDEFVELVNDSAAALDISGYTLSDFATVRHTFPAGTVLEPGCAIVVFGSGVTEGRSVTFGGALLQNANGANEFGLALNNSGDLLSIKNLEGVEVAGANWGETSTSDGSLTLDPDLNENNTFTVHNVLGAPFSPGKTTTGDPFCQAPEIQLSVIPATISEDAGAGAVELSITRSGDISSALTVNLSSSDTTEATVAATATFAANEDEISIDIDIQDDAAQDGTQTVTITGSAPGYVDGSATLEVTDNGDAAATVYINEVDYDRHKTPDNDRGTDSAGLEFVELYDGGGGNTPLDGFVLVFYNGNANDPDDEEYRFIDLNGQQTDASGFYVVTTPSNGIQNGGSGGDGIALYRGAAAADFNGTTPLTPPAGAVLVDALVYEIGDGILAAGLQYTGPDLTDSNTADPLAISRVPDGTGEFQLAPLTRGISNNQGAPSAYTTWSSEFPGIGDPGDDNDSDGIPNLLEFALGLDPLSFNVLPSPTINASGNLTISVTKGTEAANDPKTSYFAQFSTDAINWSDTDVSVVTDNGTTFTVEYTGNTSMALLRIGVSVAE